MKFHVGQRVKTSESGNSGDPVEGIISYINGSHLYIASNNRNNNGGHTEEARMAGLEYAWAVRLTDKRITPLYSITNFIL